MANRADLDHLDALHRVYDDADADLYDVREASYEISDAYPAMAAELRELRATAALFRRYVEHVGCSEGTDFTDYHWATTEMPAHDLAIIRGLRVAHTPPTSESDDE